MKPSRMVFSLLLPLLLALCLYRLASTPARVSALSTGTPASTTGALASRAVCLADPRFAEGPQAGYSGAPREATCHWCHTTYRINDPSGGVTINGLPDSYVAGGDPVDFTVTVAQDGTNDANKDWGFELTVLDANSLFAGTLVATDETMTQVVNDGGRVDGSTRYYVEQTANGIFLSDGAPSATWSMRWVPPDTDVGLVTFYVAGNAGTGHFISSATYVFLSNQTVLGPGTKFVAHALPRSDRRHGPKNVWPSRPGRAQRAAFPGSPDSWLGFAPRRNGVAPLLLAPVSAHCLSCMSMDRL